MALDPSLRVRLTRHAIPRFTGNTLFDEVARAVCEAECLPRKELYESWEFARRLRRHARGGRVVDLAAGHGLLGALLLLLDDRSPEVICVDKRIAKSAPRVLAALTARWPRLAGRVTHLEADIADFPLDAGDLVVSAHACGPLSDEVIARAIEVDARVALLPCCHALSDPESKRYAGWLDGALTLDVRRAMRLERAGYRVLTRKIPEEITPKNRLLIGLPTRPRP